MSMLKFDQERRATFQLEHLDSRARYEDVVVRTLLSLKRHWRFIVSIVALALAAACVVIPAMPRKYSAVALISPNLYSQQQEKNVALASVDAALIVNGEARLITSDAILQAAVKRLGPDRDAGASPMLDWLRAMFLPETRSHSPLDRQVAILRNKVGVMKDGRSYLISISYTASSADEAARIVNAIAVEYVRGKSLQRRRDAVAAAETELAQQLAVYGDKHPKVLQAAEALDAAHAALEAIMAPDESSPDAALTDQSVKLAIPNLTPTSPKGLVILSISFLLSLLIGMGLAVWCDRRGLEPRQFLLDLLLPRLRSGQLLVGGLLHRHAGRRFGMDVLVEASAWRRLGNGLVAPFRQALAVLHARRQQAAALPFGSDKVDPSGSIEVGEARSSRARRRRARRLRNKEIAGRAEHPHGP
jgi:capsular polysaccharide biosynthesis protein